MFQNQVRENAQNRNADQTHCGTEDQDAIRPIVSDHAGQQNDCERSDHRYCGTDCHQYEYVAGPGQRKRRVRPHAGVKRAMQGHFRALESSVRKMSLQTSSPMGLGYSLCCKAS